jgi:hypothetical protein
MFFFVPSPDRKLVSTMSNIKKLMEDVKYLRISKVVDVTYDRGEPGEEISYEIRGEDGASKEMKPATTKQLAAVNDAIKKLGIGRNVEEMMDSVMIPSALYVKKEIENSTGKVIAGVSSDEDGNVFVEDKDNMLNGTFKFKSVDKFSFSFEFRVTIAYLEEMSMGAYSICSITDEYNKSEGTKRANKRLFSAAMRALNGTAGKPYQVKGAFEFGKLNGQVAGLKK